MPTLAEYVDFAIHAVHVAGDAILPYFRASPDIENKGLLGAFDPVTAGDRAGEDAIRREIKRAFPDHGMLGEERGEERGTSPYTWSIDPIDGTRAFILGQLHWGTLLALHDGTRPIVGVMRQPYVDETFVGSALGACLHRGDSQQPLRTHTRTALDRAIVCATDPTMFHTEAMRAAFDRVAAKARSVRWGGDCYTPCLVAGGHADIVIEATLKPWDVQPLVPIIEAAGGVITDWSGGPADRADRVVIAANAELHAAVLAALAWKN
jgi:histidinol phosphatase-like enzyme (inositol monophosphatase family)